MPPAIVWRTSTDLLTVITSLSIAVMVSAPLATPASDGPLSTRIELSFGSAPSSGCSGSMRASLIATTVQVPTCPAIFTVWPTRKPMAFQSKPARTIVPPLLPFGVTVKLLVT
ncbi:hypothetical protein D9M70_598160 [compost metagenome]